jgi:6-phosphogluconolactonase
MHTEHAFEHSNAWADQLAHRIAQLLQAAIQARGHASMAVSGGQSPVPVFERLSRLPLPWQQVTVTLVDERCVAESHPDSNARLVHLHLLQHRAAQALWVAWIGANGHHDALSDADCLARCIAQLEKVPMPLDVVVLGMGPDGHTASLFPCSPDLQHALHTRQACAVVHPTTALHTRLTLSLNTLLSARHVLLQLSGSEKHAVYQQACHGINDRWPVSHVLASPATSVEVWLSR